MVAVGKLKASSQANRTADRICEAVVIFQCLVESYSRELLDLYRKYTYLVSIIPVNGRFVQVLGFTIFDW
jgi:hypothetical protein